MSKYNYNGNQAKQIEKDKASSTMITSCMDLTIRNFMQCVFQKNYRVLLLSGDASDEQLHDAWNVLYEEYAGLTGNDTYARMIGIMQEIIRLNGKYMTVKACLAVLAIRYDDETAANLKKIGYNTKLTDKMFHDWITGRSNEYHRGLMILQSNAKNIELQIKTKYDELQKIEHENKPTKKEVKEADFLQNMSVISKHMGFRIDINTCSIAEYATYQRQYHKYYESEMLKSASNGKAIS